MKFELVHEPTAGPRPFILRCRFAGSIIEIGYRTDAEAEEARPEFSRACREAFRS